MLITNRDIAWYTLALKIAATSSAHDKHGCVLVSSGHILEVATNRSAISHPISNKFLKCDIHAEQRVLLKAKSTIGTTLYSARDHRNLISYPCSMCEYLLLKAGVKWVVCHNGITLQKVRIT